VISATGFNYLAGKVEAAIPINSESREGHPYLQFEQFGKRILSHRFIAAVTLGKWVPRECNIDHINHNPSDNRPVNLRITTPRDNMDNRRNALLSELADIDQVGRSRRDVELARKAEIASEAKRKSELKPRRQEITKLPAKVVPKPLPEVLRTEEDPKFAWLRTNTGEPRLANSYTGETKPGAASGMFFMTTQGSWHWYPDGQAPTAHKPDIDDIPW
jgi:hypothetical protein